MKYVLHPMEFKSIKELPVADRPRERLIRTGVQSLSDAELLCAILGQGTKQVPVQDIADEILELLARNNGNIDYSKLSEIKGLGSAKCAEICASIELGRRLIPQKKRTINGPKDVWELLKHYGDRQQEHFFCIPVNGALEIIAVNLISIGLVNRTLVHPREVFSDAVLQRATAVVLAHSHPSGRLQPSQDDMDVTSSLTKAGKILGIEVADHIVFSSEDYYSLRENGEIWL